MSHMKSNKLFRKKQYRFLPRRSTVLHLIKVTDSLSKAPDEGKTVHVIYCDFFKALDKFPHKRLMKKVTCCCR